MRLTVCNVLIFIYSPYKCGSINEKGISIATRIKKKMGRVVNLIFIAEKIE